MALRQFVFTYLQATDTYVVRNLHQNDKSCKLSFCEMNLDEQVIENEQELMLLYFIANGLNVKNLNCRLHGYDPLL